MYQRGSLFAAVSLALLTTMPAFAAVITYTGEDLNVGPGGAHPLASAAAANFNAAVTNAAPVITFENAPVGSFTSLVVVPGVTITGASFNGSNQSINNTPNFPSAPPVDGFNTTPGGVNYLEVTGGSVTFTFAKPINAFGAYFPGVQNFFNDFLQFSDGTTQTVALPNVGTSNAIGALDFVGFTDFGASITSITLNAGTTSATGIDALGVDDIRFQTVPEPTSIALLSLSAAALLSRRRR